MTNSAEEEVLLKAKEITARLAGVAPTTTATAATTNTTTATKTSSTKRKRWGVAPDNVAATTSTTSGMNPNTNPVAASAVAHAFNLSGLKEAALAKKAKLEEDMKTKREKRLWISATRERPASFWVNFLKPLIGNLLDEVASKGGTPGTAGKDDEQEVTICLQGRGSSDRPPLPGIPEEPLHILIKATPPKMDIVEPRVDQFLQDAEHAPVPPIDHDHDNQEEENKNKNNNSALALTTMGDSGFKSSLSTYRPATVAQLIGQAHHLQNNQSAGDVDHDNQESVGIQVPNGMVGFIIGRGGETISSIQGRTGAKVQIQKEHELKPGQTLRQITLTAATKEGVMQAKSMIQTMVEDRLNQENLNSSGHNQSGGNNAGTGNRSNSRNGVAEAVAAGHALVPVAVPDADVGLIIGKGGSTIQNIQQQTGASIQIPPSADLDNSQIRTVRVTHPNEENAQQAKRMIEDVLKTKTSHFRVAASGPQLTVQVMIPDKDVGLCIGRQGCVIREMQNKSGARIQIPGQPTPGQPHRIATVSGSQEGCNTVQQMIERIIVEQSSQFVMNSAITGGGSQYYSNQQNPNGGQQNHYNNAGQQAGGASAAGGKDYSAEWAAYYAAQAQAQQNQQQQQQVAAAVQTQHHQQYAQQQQTNQYQQQYQQQAAAQQTAVQQQATATAAAPAAASGADTYHEQYFRYAYYYGDDAAKKYYGAWSPAVGTPNPYGTNPNGVTAPPAGGNTATAATGAVAVTASTAPAAAVPATQVKDSSMRKVSNLPAWMTRQ